MATLTAGDCGTFPEVELICWLRSSLGRAKVLLVQAVRRHGLGTLPRSFEISERELSEAQVGVLTSSLMDLGLGRWVPRIEDTSTPESIWWARLTLGVMIDGASLSLEAHIGPEGLRGEDAEALQTFFQVFLSAAGCRDEPVLNLLTTPRPDF
jgi:hypothetical protein